MNKDKVELTILMPCLNESETLAVCIKKARKFLKKHKIIGEILIADNGSTDASVKIAQKLKARVIHVPQKGYGSALIAGNKAANGQYIIMGDADNSYDFTALMPFVEQLRTGYDLVMGNRFAGGIEPGAMPALHQYLGNPILSMFGKIFYRSRINDFHCGLRGYSKKAILSLHLETTGMEYASEMIVKATIHGLKTTEVPIVLHKDGRSHPSHLNSWSDGWRHLQFLLLYSPDWLFLYPGLSILFLSLFSLILLFFAPIKVESVVFDIHTMLYAAGFLLAGLNIVLYSIFFKLYAVKNNFIKADKFTHLFSNKIFTLNRGILVGLLLFFFGLMLSVSAVIIWKNSSFGNLEPNQIMRLTIPAMVSIVVGIELVMASFFVEILKKNKN
jgi:glycosyltransferase involved in cell wall biosynthesis